MAALQYPIVIAEIPIRWDEPAWLPDPSPVFEDTANANYNMIRDIESHDALLQQLVPPTAAGGRTGGVGGAAGGGGGGAGSSTGGAGTSGAEDDDSDVSVGSSDNGIDDALSLRAAPGGSS